MRNVAAKHILNTHPGRFVLVKARKANSLIGATISVVSSDITFTAVGGQSGGQQHEGIFEKKLTQSALLIKIGSKNKQAELTIT